MRLTGRDLDAIRGVVRDELERVMHDARGARLSDKEADPVDPEIERYVDEWLDQSRQETRARAARPIPLRGDLDLSDAGRVAKVTGQTVGQWIRRGWLPRRKSGGRLVVDRAELERFLAGRGKD